MFENVKNWLEPEKVERFNRWEDEEYANDEGFVRCEERFLATVPMPAEYKTFLSERKSIFFTFTNPFVPVVDELVFFSFSESYFMKTAHPDFEEHEDLFVVGVIGAENYIISDGKYLYQIEHSWEFTDENRVKIANDMTSYLNNKSDFLFSLKFSDNLTREMDYDEHELFLLKTKEELGFIE